MGKKIHYYSLFQLTGTVVYLQQKPTHYVVCFTISWQQKPFHCNYPGAVGVCFRKRVIISWYFVWHACRLIIFFTLFFLLPPLLIRSVLETILRDGWSFQNTNNQTKQKQNKIIIIFKNRFFPQPPYILKLLLLFFNIIIILRLFFYTIIFKIK